MKNGENLAIFWVGGYYDFLGMVRGTRAKELRREGLNYKYGSEHEKAFLTSVDHCKHYFSGSCFHVTLRLSTFARDTKDGCS